MDLIEFRKRAERGKGPENFNLDTRVECVRRVFEAYRIMFASMGRIEVCVPIEIHSKADQMFIKWMIETTHDAYTIYSRSNDETFRVCRFGRVVIKEDYTMVTFIPKGATKEEIERSTGAKMMDD